MRVIPIAFTEIDWSTVLFSYTGEPWSVFMDERDDILPARDVLAEAAGRVCYDSWDNPSGKDNQQYLENILKQGHESVLEHSSVTFYVDGVSRSLLAELSRHRHLSFSVQSQRYVDETKGRYVVPPAVKDDDLLKEALHTFHEEVTNYYALIVAGLTIGSKKLPRKKAREVARAVLPQMQETKMIVTGNLRAWRDVLKKRHHIAADAEIQEFADKVLGHLRNLAPNSVQDISDVPFS